MPQVKPKTVGSSTRSMRIDAFSPLVHVISAGATGPQVDRRRIAEPGAEALGRGQRRPHPGGRMRDLDGPLDSIGKSHDSLLMM